MAPDYVLCHSEHVEKLYGALKKVRELNWRQQHTAGSWYLMRVVCVVVSQAVLKFYGPDPLQNPDFARMVNSAAAARVQDWLQQSTNDATEFEYGSEGLSRTQKLAADRTYVWQPKDYIADASSKIDGTFVPPTIVVNPPKDSILVREEIFGPILPIVVVESDADAIEYVNKGEKPLALYVFGKNENSCSQAVDCMSCGGATINDTLMHTTVEELPFGGVGNSGMGAYHGKRSVLIFSHHKAVMIKQQNLEVVNDLRYPPYSDKKRKILGFVTCVRAASSTLRCRVCLLTV